MTIREFGEKIGLHEDAIVQSEKLYEIFKDDALYAEIMKEIDSDRDSHEIETMCEELAEKYGLVAHQVELAVLLCCGDITKAIFERLGYTEKLCFDSATDIRCKANECKNLNGYWGTFVFYWCVRVLRGGIHRLGRLEFETYPSPFDVTIEGASIKQGEPIIGVHIPLDGPLLMEDVSDSFQQAYDFYGIDYSGYVFIACSSWMLYPPFVEMFKEGSNLKKFADLFEIHQVNVSDEFRVAWRIFNTRDISNPDALPADTSLRRSMIEYIKNGGKAGDGYGVTAYKGKK